MKTVNQITGEFIEVKHNRKQKLVKKFVDGVLRSSYPVDSRGRALLIMRNQIQ